MGSSVLGRLKTLLCVPTVARDKARSQYSRPTQSVMTLHVVVLGCVLSLVSQSAHADEVYQGLQTPNHTNEIDLKTVPEGWRNQPRSSLFFVAPVPPDPPEAASGAKKLVPGRESELYLDLGDKVRLDPKALEQGWRFEGAETSAGVLWPIPGAPRVFFARCPGEARIWLSRARGQIPSAPDFKGISSEPATFMIHVRPGGHSKATCDSDFDPPRVLNPGVVTGEFLGQGIQLHVGDSFVLQPPKQCVEVWKKYRLSRPDIITATKGPPDTIIFVAKKPGTTILTLAHPVRCESMVGLANILVAVY